LTVPVSVPNHEPMTTIVNIGEVRLNVRFDLDFQSSNKHPSGSFTNKIIKKRARIPSHGSVMDYLQHWRAFFAGTAIPDSSSLA
jgi:hypothetical protein